MEEINARARERNTSRSELILEAVL
ncbi:hypothetical protein [Corynebacterium cystitidis]|nr:hypothetical protein [Corynebacterium cystitidis]